jgi:hypothetical protein
MGILVQETATERRRADNRAAVSASFRMLSRLVRGRDLFLKISPRNGLLQYGVWRVLRVWRG